MVVKKEKVVPAMNANDLGSSLSKHGVHLFRDYPGMALNQVQRNLHGRTLWAEDSNLKSRKASIEAVSVMDEGLILGVVEKAQKTANPADGVVYRPVFFDVFGNIIDTVELAEAPDTKKGAMAELWKRADDIDAVRSTIEGAKEKQSSMQKALEEFTELLDEME
jgi:hypothetical protein